jgi:large subunit ribosomal protein L19e
MNPERASEIEAAMTREDIKSLISDKAIKVRPELGVSRGRARILHEKRKCGKRRGPGKRRGSSGARLSTKTRWISTIRAVRNRLKKLREDKAITDQVYHRLYLMSKGGAFKSVSHLDQYIEASGISRRKMKQ